MNWFAFFLYIWDPEHSRNLGHLSVGTWETAALKAKVFELEYVIESLLKKQEEQSLGQVTSAWLFFVLVLILFAYGRNAFSSFDVSVILKFI